MDAPMSKDRLFGNSVTAVVEKFRAAKQQSAFFRLLLPHRPREIEQRHTLVARSRLSSSHRQRGAPREEPSPMAPPRKDWGPRAYPPARQRQQKRLDMSSTAKTSRPQAPSSSSWSFCCSSGTVPSTRERCSLQAQTLTVSLQNTPRAALEQATTPNIPSDNLRASAFRVRGTAQGSVGILLEWILL